MNDVELGFAFLLTQTFAGLLSIFWYTVIFEAPRYLLPFVAAGLTLRSRTTDPVPVLHQSVKNLSVSVVLIGHNEEGSLEACVRSLKEQSLSNFEIIIVSDGSLDKMGDVARQLTARGLSTQVLTTDLRGGKSSGINLAWREAKGDIVINVDCDCSFDRFAVEFLLEPFVDPKVGCVCGDIAPRNSGETLISQFQEIEYLQSISVGKRISNTVDQVVCASGAFSAFRREALVQVSGFDVGGGEDLDITLRMRSAGWKIVFAPESICYTDVPTAAFNLIRQRMRWERDSIWVRYRKHARLMNVQNKDFRFSEAFHELDFLIFSVFGAAMFPFYMVWLAMQYGSFTIAILIAMQLGLLVLDVCVLALSAWITRRPVFWRNLPFLPGYSIFNSYVMRMVRLWAYIDEWCFSGSHRDNYTPSKVRLERPW